MLQLKHNQTQNQPQTFPIVVIGEALRTPQNVGMCLRVSEAFGVQTFYIHEHSPNKENRIVQRTARNTEKTLKTHIYSNIFTEIETLKHKGYTLIALEITNHSQNIQQYNFNQHQKIALLIGSERFGIQKEVLHLCDTSIHIPMHGLNSSMNVVNSLSVCLYEMTKQMSS